MSARDVALRVVLRVFEQDAYADRAFRAEADAAALERVSELIAPLVLIGWDTGGAAWDP